MKKLITINIIAYNEQIMLPFILSHYKSMFSDPRIVVYDNESTDNTREIALDAGCQVFKFSTNSSMNDTIHATIKSEAARICPSEWVLCIDCDEACLITEDDLKNADFNAVHFKGYEIFDDVESPFLATTQGCESVGYSKPILLKTGCFENIKFAAGAHQVSFNTLPNVEVKWSKDEFKLLHYKHWRFNYSLGRSKELGARQSQENLAKKHSFHFNLPYEVHLDYYTNGFNNRRPIEDERLKLIKK